MTNKELIDNKRYINLLVNKIKNFKKNFNPDIKNISFISLKNKDISNKNYKKNLLNISNKQKMSIYLKGLNVINKHLKNIISI
jgi:hypothetical protein